METPGDPESGEEKQNEIPTTPTTSCDTTIKLEQSPSELERSDDQGPTIADVSVGTIKEENNIDEQNRISVSKSPAKTVTFTLPSVSIDEDGGDRDSPVLRKKKPKTIWVFSHV